MSIDGSKKSALGRQGLALYWPEERREPLFSGIDIRVAYRYLAQSFPEFIACMEERRATDCLHINDNPLVCYLHLQLQRSAMFSLGVHSTRPGLIILPHQAIS
jgi:hypothetical protein